jgi:hypothetical protein
MGGRRGSRVGAATAVLRGTRSTRAVAGSPPARVGRVGNASWAGAARAAAVLGAAPGDDRVPRAVRGAPEG